jgi:hypothetical protein
MALYALCLILFLGIPFLLYCLYNFAHELWPSKRLLSISSRAQTLGFMPTGTVPGNRHKNLPLESQMKSHPSGHDYLTAPKLS